MYTHTLLTCTGGMYLLTLRNIALYNQAAAYSLRLKLAQGLDLSGATHEREAQGKDSEINASIEVLLQEPELVLQDPTSSRTGLALQGLLTAQVASRVGVNVQCHSHAVFLSCQSYVC